jgi:methoxymalonate biosynthesis acyl carrier protein
MTVSSDSTTVGNEIQKFLKEKTKRSWEPDVDIFAAGGLSSLFAMELVVFLEQTFQITIVGSDLQLGNFRTVDAMIAMVAKLGGLDG